MSIRWSPPEGPSNRAHWEAIINSVMVGAATEMTLVSKGVRWRVQVAADPGLQGQLVRELRSLGLPADEED